MHMGDLNADPNFLSIMVKLQLELDTISKEIGLKNFASKITVYDVLLYRRTAKQILRYFRTIQGVLKHHHATLKLKSCKWFQDICEFVGMDVATEVTQPLHSKN